MHSPSKHATASTPQQARHNKHFQDTLLHTDTMNQNQTSRETTQDIPEELKKASATYNPTYIFATAGKFYVPKVVAIAQERPYSGAAIHGFIEHIPYKGPVIFNAFCIRYYDNNSAQTTYVGLDDLVSMKILYYSSHLLQVLRTVAMASGKTFDYDTQQKRMMIAHQMIGLTTNNGSEPATSKTKTKKEGGDEPTTSKTETNEEDNNDWELV